MSEPKLHYCFLDIPSLVWQIAVNGASDETAVADAGGDINTRIRRCDSAGLATAVPWMELSWVKKRMVIMMICLGRM